MPEPQDCLCQTVNKIKKHKIKIKQAWRQIISRSFTKVFHQEEQVPCRLPFKLGKTELSLFFKLSCDLEKGSKSPNLVWTCKTQWRLPSCRVSKSSLKRYLRKWPILRLLQTGNMRQLCVLKVDVHDHVPIVTTKQRLNLIKTSQENTIFCFGFPTPMWPWKSIKVTKTGREV